MRLNPQKSGIEAKSAVLLLVFNRPDLTRKVFDSIRLAKPPRLYIASDGPRPGFPADLALIREVREVVATIDWACEVTRLYRDENLGCKQSVSEAITWFFESEEQGIILEDDCLPSSDFFSFCDEILKTYAKQQNVMAVTGNNFQKGRQRGSASYYFSHFPHVWGWATWKRAWELYDVDIKFWNSWSTSHEWQRRMPNSSERAYWENVLNSVSRGEVDTWDYQLAACLWFHGGLVATPNVNLVSNIGFGSSATHTSNANSRLSSLPVGSISSVTHPKVIERDLKADNYVFNRVFRPAHMRFPIGLLTMDQIGFLRRVRDRLRPFPGR